YAVLKHRADRRSDRAWRALLPCATALVLTVFWVFALRPGTSGPNFSLDVLAVGNGSCALLTAPDGRAAVFDVGTLFACDAGRPLVDAAGVRGARQLALLSISHANIDHYSGAPTVLGSLPCERIAVHQAFSAYRATMPAVARLFRALPAGAP